MTKKIVNNVFPVGPNLPRGCVVLKPGKIERWIRAPRLWAFVGFKAMGDVARAIRATASNGQSVKDLTLRHNATLVWAIQGYMLSPTGLKLAGLRLARCECIPGKGHNCGQGRSQRQG